ncbi:MAG: TRAP transporter substrate-binding protein [Candidatus Acidiferrum sp.]
MKSAFGTSKSILFALLSFAAMAPLSSHAQSKMRLATLLPQGSSQYQSLEKMGQDWRKSTKGSVTLIVYGGGMMGSEEDSVRRMRIDQLQAATLSIAGLSEIDPHVAALEKIPMLFRSLNEVEYVRAKMRDELERSLEQKGFIVLFWADAGWIQVFSRRPIQHPSDLKRTKLFVTVGDQDELEIVKSLGIQPVPLTWSDALVSLQTGLVDTVVTTPFLCLAGQFDLTAKHMLQLKYVPLVGATVMTKKAWSTLSPDQRAVIRKAATQAGNEIQTRSRAENVTAVEAMKRRGLQVHEVTPEMEIEWRRYLEGVYPKMRGGMVPVDVFDEVQHYLADYRAASKPGHP